MAPKGLIVALGLIVAASPVSAAVHEPLTGPPVANAEGKICLRVAPVTGSLLETIQCWTREQWADQDVDVDKEWVENGVVLNA